MRDPRLVEFARKMRREMTEPERKLWYQLRAKRFHGTKFRRQNVFGRYIADFYAREARLIIEVDGDSHAFQEDYDRVRKAYMEELGFRVLRFANGDVMNNLDGVLVEIGNVLTTPHPSPLRSSSLPPKGERAFDGAQPLSPLQGRQARLGSSLPSRSREGVLK